MADTDTRLGKWHHLFCYCFLFFCLAPVDHMSVLRLRREKLHELSSEKVQSKNKFHSDKEEVPKKVSRHSHLNHPSLGISASSPHNRFQDQQKVNFTSEVGKSRFKTHQRHYGRPTSAPRTPEQSPHGVRHVLGKCSADISPRRHRRISPWRPIKSAGGHLVSLSCPARLIRTAARRERTTSVPAFEEPFVLCVPVVFRICVWQVFFVVVAL